MPVLQIFSCGGTIDKVYFDAKSTYEIGEPQIVTVLREANVSFEYEVHSILRKDSLDMNDEDRALVRARVEGSPGSRIVITHGTDTMAQTGRALADIPGKTIVLTGAMEPARFRVTDAIFNIGSAVAAAQTMPPGVYIAMNGRIFDARRVRKNVGAARFEEDGGEAEPAVTR